MRVIIMIKFFGEKKGRSVSSFDLLFLLSQVKIINEIEFFVFVFALLQKEPKRTRSFQGNFSKLLVALKTMVLFFAHQRARAYLVFGRP